MTKELKAEGVSIIYISHRMHEVQDIADRAVVLRDGKNAGEIEGSEITHERMVRMMVGRDLKDFFKGAAGSAERESVNCFEVRRLRTLRYPNHRISFNVAKGEVLGFAGLSAPDDPKSRGRYLVSRKHWKPTSRLTAKACASTVHTTRSLTASISSLKIAVSLG